MKIETKEIYKCDYCRKLYQIKKWCKLHEPVCRKNPLNKSKCFEGCIHLTKKSIIHYVDNPDGDNEERREILYCKVKKQGVYPNWISGLESADIEDELPNNVMPKECEEYSNWLEL